MLRVDLRQLGAGGVETRGTLLPDDPTLDGLAIEFEGPIAVEGRLHATADDSFLWRGTVQATVVGECRRCLRRVEQRIDDHLDVVFSADPDLADDPSVYVLPANPSSIDVSKAVREEVALRASAFPLCGEDCKGLCPTCGADLNAGPCGCTVAGTNH
jgi:uncharacterized protein